MKKITLWATLLWAAVGGQMTTNAQSASGAQTPLEGQRAMYFPMREGAELEYHYKDTKGKRVRDRWNNERFMRLTVDKMWGDTLANVSVATEALERTKNALASDVADAVRWGDVCTTAVSTTFDNVLWWFVPEFYNDDANKHFRTKVSSVMELPHELHEGDVLPDLVHRSEYFEVDTTPKGQNDAVLRLLEEQGDFEVVETLGKDFGLWFSAAATGRHVTGLVDVTTAAGTWRCWRVEYELVGPSERYQGRPASITVMKDEVGGTDIQISFESDKEITGYADYFSPEVGLVRRERLNGTGKKVEETMELVSIK